MGEFRIDAPVKEIVLSAVKFRPCPDHHNMNIAEIGDCPNCDLTPVDLGVLARYRNPDYFPDEPTPRRAPRVPSWLRKRG